MLSSSGKDPVIETIFSKFGQRFTNSAAYVGSKEKTQLQYLDLHPGFVRKSHVWIDFFYDVTAPSLWKLYEDVSAI